MSVVGFCVVLGLFVLLLLRTAKLTLGPAMVCVLFGLVLAATPPAPRSTTHWTPPVPGCGGRWPRYEPGLAPRHPPRVQPAAAQRREGSRPPLCSARCLDRTEARPRLRRAIPARHRPPVGRRSA